MHDTSVSAGRPSPVHSIWAAPAATVPGCGGRETTEISVTTLIAGVLPTRAALNRGRANARFGRLGPAS